MLEFLLMRSNKRLASDRKHVLMISVEQAKPILMGAVGGAVALAIVGFGFGGWVTGGTAEEMANDSAESAVVAALAPICVAQFQQQSDSDNRLNELNDIRSFQRAAYIEEGGRRRPCWHSACLPVPCCMRSIASDHGKDSEIHALRQLTISLKIATLLA